MQIAIAVTFNGLVVLVAAHGPLARCDLRSPASSSVRHHVHAEPAAITSAGIGADAAEVPAAPRLAVLALATTAGLAAAAPARAADLYLDAATGRDDASGTSPAQAWASLERASQARLAPGDRLLLHGGQRFAGTLELGPEDAGTVTAPVRIATYASGRAAIDAGTGPGVEAIDAGGLEVADLEVTGAGRAGGNYASGVRFFSDLPGARKLEHLRVARVEVSGFGQAGVELSAAPPDGSKSGFRDVRISEVQTHDNADAGIIAYGPFSATAPGWSHADVHVEACTAYANRGIPGKGTNSGSGIVLGEVDGGTIERSTAYDNGALNDHPGGGPVGIWAWHANRITIQDNVSHDNRSATIDGGGFDLDGGVTSSVLQRNRSWGNAGAGYLLYQFSGARPFGGNVVRYNVSEDDGRTNLGGIAVGGGARDVDLQSNTVLTRPRADGSRPAALSVADAAGVRATDNALIATGDAPLVALAGNGVRLEGNAYWSADGTWSVRDSGRAFATLAAWRSATGQESRAGTPVGLQADPRLPVAGEPVGAPARYRPPAGSPLVDAGLGLTSRSGPWPGFDLDLARLLVPAGARPDIGALEAVAVAAAPAFPRSRSGGPTLATPVPTPGRSPAPLGSPTAPKATPRRSPPALPGPLKPSGRAGPLAITRMRPAPGARVRDRTPTFAASVRPLGQVRAGLELRLDGRARAVRFDARSGRATARLGRLRRGRHGARLVVLDRRGRRHARSWVFRVL